MEDKAAILKEFQTIPGVGKAVANDLWQMGYRAIKDLKDQNPEKMYIIHNDIKGAVQDICMLYTFRCAVYFAQTPPLLREPARLKWWNWMDETKVDSITKDRQIREKPDY